VRSIREAAGQELIWSQPAATRRSYELRAGDQVIATLRRERGSLAEAEAAEGRWTFKREGFWHPRVTVRKAGSDENIAVFNPSWMGGGTLERSGKPPLRFKAANFWRSQWDWEADESSPLLHFKSRHGLLKTQGTLEIAGGAAGEPDLGLLALLGWYLLLLFAEEAAAASSAAVVATTAH
jgi:hypothetical protein